MCRLKCSTCNSVGFAPSKTGEGCEYCDGTFGGNLPKEVEKETLWRKIDNPKEGQQVVYVGLHAIDWKPEFGMPTVAFIQADETN